jgi:transcription termination factor NusB
MTTKHFDEMSMTERWIICGLDVDKIDKILQDKNKKGLDIRFSINGVDIPFEEVTNRIDKAYETSVVEGVKEKTKSYDSLINSMSEIQELASKLKKKISASFIDD